MKIHRLIFALGFLVVAAHAAAKSSDQPRKEVTESTAAGFTKLQPLVAAKDYDAALELIEGLREQAAPESFDTYLLAQIQAQIHLTENRLAAALEPLETALGLATTNANFYETSAHLEQLYLLAQIHYQVAADHSDAEAQRAGYQRSLERIERWLELSPVPGHDQRLFAASLLYTLGTRDPEHPDHALLERALAQAQEAALALPRPSPQVRLVKVACYLQLGRHAQAAEILEIVAAANPASPGSWSQLQSLYLSLAAQEKDPLRAEAYHLRALHALERAQAHGLLGSPKDHYTRVAILFNLGQHRRAADKLEHGLGDGSLENTLRNWELLASAYLQSAETDRALETYARAVTRFPESADLDFAFAQTLHAAGRTEQAYQRARSAIAKPGLARPGQSRLYLAYLAYELRLYEQAAVWVQQARESADVDPRALDPLSRAIAEALATRGGDLRS
jgi:Tfp pilus assembly protein PilF